MSIQAGFHVPVNLTTSSLGPRPRQTFATATSSHHQGENAAEKFFAGRSHLPSKEEKRFIIGLDYGTTFTSVAYYVRRTTEEDIRPGDIKTIRNWPDDNANGGSEQVPTESWYPSTPIDRPAIEDQFDAPDRISSERHHDCPANLSSVGKGEDIYEDEYIEPSGMDSDDSKEFLWGYSVSYQRYNAHTTRNSMRRIEHAKLMLVKTPYTRNERTELRRKVNHLINRKIIRKYGKRSEPDVRDVRDLITDFLIKVFRHTKEQLIIYENYSDQSSVEFVISVPTIWSPEGSRVLQVCVETAIDATGLGRLMDGSVDNLFIIPEPEAAATFLLLGHSKTLEPDATVTVLDCGGGTVDGSTYHTDLCWPLRLKHEAVEPGGDNCGGSYVNENFHRRVLDRLKHETYLEQFGETRKALVDYLMPEFEAVHKRKIDVTARPILRLRIPGLRGDKRRGPGIEQKGFNNNYLLMDTTDFEIIFLPLLERTAAVLQGQIQASMEKGKLVKTVFLVGGFSGAPSLVSYIRNFVLELSRKLNLPYEISVIEDQKKCVSAVAAGAVARALNKDNGPKRYAQCSYGLLRLEPYEPKVFPAHEHATAKEDQLDGDRYVKVINYFMIRGSLIPHYFEFEPLYTFHTFDVDNLPLRCEELLYVSDTATLSHYTLTNDRNRGAQLAGSINTDMSFLRDEGYIRIIQPEINPYTQRPSGKSHYRVEYDIVVIVENRNLKFESRWPSKQAAYAGDQVLSLPETPEVRQRGQLSLAAAFHPGTG